VVANRLLSILALIIVVASTTVSCGGGSPCPSTLTILSIATGNVSVMKAGTNDWTGAQVGTKLEVGDTIKTGEDSGAEITFFDGSTMDMEAGTQIEILSLAIACDTGVTTISLLQTIGTTISRVTKILDPASRYEVETPSGVVGVRGSGVRIQVFVGNSSYRDGTTLVTNLGGHIYAIAQGVEVQVPEGQTCIIIPEQPPKLIMMVAAGGLHTVGLKCDGTVVAVGDNGFGECDVGNWTGIVQVAAGYQHTVGLKADGTVAATGDNYYRQCAVGNWTGIIQVAAGYAHTVGLKADGTVVAVGLNTYGQCAVGNWTGIIQVAAGYAHTVGLKADGTVVATGENDYGQCNVGEWTGITQVSAGYAHTVGLKADGTVVAVGDNSVEQCNVGEWTGIIQVSAGAFHTVVLKSDHTADAVGDNSTGQCYVGSWAGITQVSAGNAHTVGLRADGTVVAVGCGGETGNWGQCDVSGWVLK
jgi:hypothetical protein